MAAMRAAAAEAGVADRLTVLTGISEADKAGITSIAWLICSRRWPRASACRWWRPCSSASPFSEPPHRAARGGRRGGVLFRRLFGRGNAPDAGRRAGPALARPRRRGAGQARGSSAGRRRQPSIWLFIRK
ncbi:MAG: hypothetical protein WKG07_10500 [Hymenobacter sp.]